MTEEIWKTLVIAVRSMEDSPSWLRDTGNLSYEQVVQLPRLGSETTGAIARPYVTEDVIKPDYLDFLREQIGLNARGPEWTAVLQGRLIALQPFVGKKVLMADFYRKPNSATLYINPETGELFQVEIF